MIGPFSQTQSGPPDVRGPSSDPQRGAGASDLFAQLLGAAAAVVPGPQVELPDSGAGSGGVDPRLAAPQPEEMPVGAPALDGPQLGDAAVNQPAPLARVFNQDGFFGRMSDAPSEAVILPPEAVAGEAAAVAGPGAAPVKAGLALPGSALPGGTGPAGRVAAGRASEARFAAPAAKAVGTRPAGLASARGTAALVEGEEAEPLAPVQRRVFRGLPGTQSTLHVALSEVERGLQVAVRINGLDDAERRQLRDEIAALLGRHGLSAGPIQIYSMPLRESE